MQSLSIRAATVADAGRICAIHRDSVIILCTGYYTRRQIDGWLEGYEVSTHRTAISTGSLWVADDGDIQGFVEAVGDTVTKLFVRPARTMSGLGTALLQHAVSVISRAGHTRAYVEATKNSEAFYRRFGFKVVARGYSRHKNRAAKLEVARMQRTIG